MSPPGDLSLRVFASDQELPEGSITVLEASAGTGKTHTITSLIVRLIVEEGIAIDRIAVVTFTRAATEELEDRVRSRLREALQALDAQGAQDDPSQRVHRQRLLRALEGFDQCLISTIHGFCQRILQLHAFEARADFDLELIEDTTPLLAEMVDDWLSRELYAGDGRRHRFLVEDCKYNRNTLGAIAREVLREPGMAILPTPDASATEPLWRAQLQALRQSLEGGWSKELPQAFEQWKKQGLFKPRQATYNAKKAAAELQALGDWLAGDPDWLDPPPQKPLDYFSPKKLAEKLAPEQASPEHPALDAIAALGAFIPDRVGHERARFARWVRQQFEARCEQARVQSFADLMGGLSRVLAREATDAGRRALIEAVRERLRVALIDEFQDTDAEQWAIFQTLFSGPEQRLFLIGDPKQAIYGFRGANVHVYLEAKRAAQERVFTLEKNYRSDTRYVEALNHMMAREGFFGAEGIDYVRVQAAQKGDRLAPGRPWSLPSSAPLQLRFVDASLEGREGDDEAVSGHRIVPRLAASVADEIVELLQSPLRIEDPGAEGSDGDGFRPLHAGDIAILTRTGQQARALSSALAEAAVPSVLQGTDSVLGSEQAQDLLHWLQALASPGDDRAARVVATSDLFGRNAELIRALDAEAPQALAEWNRFVARLARWREHHGRHGLMATVRLAFEEEGVAPRLLAQRGGERAMTNLMHVAELLHEAEHRGRLGLEGLLSWLRNESERGQMQAERLELRLETDGDAVQIMTVHKAKGLQFNIVFVPFSFWSRLPQASAAALVAPGEADPAARVCDLRAPDARRQTHRRAVREAQEEAIRLFYVALTRARLRTVVHVGHLEGLEHSALAPVFHAGENLEAGADRIEIATARVCDGDGEARFWELQQLASSSNGHISLSSAAAPRGLRLPASTDAAPELCTRDFERDGLDSIWRRSSYTDLTRHRPTHLAEQEREGIDVDAFAVLEDLAQPPALASALAEAEASPLPLASFPAGRDTGIFLHTLLEHADFTWALPERPPEQGPEPLRALIGATLQSHGMDTARWLELLTTALTQVLRTPLGAVLGSARLCDVAQQARFDELGFDFPVAGGSAFRRGRGHRPVPSERLVQALAARPADDPALRADYLRGLGGLGELAGFMTGRIDLIFRHPVADHGRYFVVDYKSNRLGGANSGRSGIHDYDHASMRQAMEQHDYYLQYHLYTLVLHRYLRLRLGEAYDYERDVGGVYYLFLRGMVGADTPEQAGRRHGCFFDKPPRQVIEALDAVFDGPAGAQERRP
ncbi:MAG: exodeoxyribonuclease V subunit beta [Myxococcales bacterium]|nr:exodeoxyribonuclease V subunit beta [Myxococcales bacterium]